MLEASNWLGDSVRVLRGERAFSRLCYSQLRDKDHWLREVKGEMVWSTVPRPITWALNLLPGDAVLDRNQAAMEQALQDDLEVVNVARRKIAPAKLQEVERVSEASWSTPYNWFAKSSFPVHSGILVLGATAEVAVTEARTACAIERFRLTNGRLPTSLPELVPAFLPSVPGDALADRPLRFAVGPDQAYRLYSVGWNQTDDDGTVALRPNSTRRDDKKGDWVWWSAPR